MQLGDSTRQHLAQKRPERLSSDLKNGPAFGTGPGLGFLRTSKQNLKAKVFWQPKTEAGLGLRASSPGPDSPHRAFGLFLFRPPVLRDGT